MLRVATPEDLVGAPEGPAWTNRLVHETSPYLLQHAHNPVDWYPWGPEAFERARREDKPIFLSIGYAACHWCHVMEHESFADPTVAAVLNQGFVPVKVDREERPDVDSIYIEALHAFQGHAGWPANLFLLPDRRPFAGITYLPPVERHGTPSFGAVLERVRSFWVGRRADLERTGASIQEALSKGFSPAGRGPGAQGFDDAVRYAVAAQDPQHGGLGTGQKFPQTAVVEMLLLGARDGVEGAREALVSSLAAMARGGLYDHLGGGFHRYCVDRAWTVPHFEKMLYDNAQLLRLYARAASLFAADDAALARECVRVVRGTVRYLSLDLTGPDGLLWSSEDADDPGGEGFFYTFTAQEARAVLGTGTLPFGIDDHGNFEHGRTVLSTWEGRPPERVRQALLAARAARARPAVDTKRVVAWNGLAIGALAEAGRLLGFDEWVDRAARAADALLAAIGEHVPRVVGTETPGTLEDHAFLADGLLDLFQARPHQIRWLDEAVRVVGRAVAGLADPAGGFFQADDRPDLIVRRKDFHDGAEPSGNGRMADVLRRLGAYGAPFSPDLLDGVLAAASEWMRAAPVATPGLWSVTRGLATGARGPLELVIAGRPDHPETLAMLRGWSRRWRPQGLVAVVAPGSDAAARYGLFADRPSGPAGAPLAYLCRHGVCDLPVARAADLERALG